MSEEPRIKMSNPQVFMSCDWGDNMDALGLDEEGNPVPFMDLSPGVVEVTIDCEPEINFDEAGYEEDDGEVIE